MSTANWCSDSSSSGDAEKDAFGVQSTVKLSYLCANGWQPLLITGFIRDFLQRQWCDALNVINPELHQYLWHETAPSSIVIESVHRHRFDKVERRPAILIKRNSFRNMPLGIAASIMGGGMVAYPTEKGAITRYTTLFVGSHTLFCIHQTGASAEILAAEVMGQLIGFMVPIRQLLGLRQFSVVEVGAVQPITTEASENMVVPITVGWCYELNWQLREQSLPLQDISFVGILGDGEVISLSNLQS